MGVKALQIEPMGRKKRVYKCPNCDGFEHGILPEAIMMVSA